MSEGLTFNLVTMDSNAKGTLSIQEMSDELLKKYNKNAVFPYEATVVGLAKTKKKVFLPEISKGSEIYINPDYYDYIYPVILHEVLHTLGFRDVNRGGTIMRSVIGSPDSDLSQDDIDALNYFYPAKDNAKEKSSSRTR